MSRAPADRSATSPAAHAAVTTSPAADATASSAPRSSRVWLWVVAAFALQLVAWTAWFVIAAQHRVAEVPLETAAGHQR